MYLYTCFIFFFFNDTATTEIYTLFPTRRSSDLCDPLPAPSSSNDSGSAATPHPMCKSADSAHPARLLPAESPWHDLLPPPSAPPAAAQPAPPPHPIRAPSPPASAARSRASGRGF